MASGNHARNAAIQLMLVAVLLAPGCDVKISMAQTTIGATTRPHWQVGQTWRVEYSRNVPSTKKMPVTSPPPPQRSIWTYRVVKPSDQEPAIVIAAQENSGDRIYEMSFDLSDASLRSVVEVSRPTPDPVIRNRLHHPYFGYVPIYPILFDWPRFPVAERDLKFTFKTDEGQIVTQSTNFFEGGKFIVAMSYRRDIDAVFQRSSA